MAVGALRSRQGPDLRTAPTASSRQYAHALVLARARAVRPLAPVIQNTALFEPAPGTAGAVRVQATDPLTVSSARLAAWTVTGELPAVVGALTRLPVAAIRLTPRAASRGRRGMPGGLAVGDEGAADGRAEEHLGCRRGTSTVADAARYP